MTTSLSDAALRYAELGYPVFPCSPSGKAPITAHGFKDATTDPAQIKAWWEKHPSANIGMPTAGLFVIDVDGKDNHWPGDADKAMDLARGPVSLTPRGGRHHIFRQPKDADWKNTASKLAPKVDTRANGGYIVVPPSQVDGKPYRWAETLELDDPPEQLPEPPEWIVAQLEGMELLARSAEASNKETSPNAGTPTQDEDTPPDTNAIPPGQRNDALARLAGTMRRVGMSRTEICAALAQVNADRCKPPLSAREVERIAASICRYEPDQITVATVENHWAQDQAAGAPEESAPRLEDPGPLPDELLRVPGFVSEVMDYCLATAPYPNLVMAFCGALALQAFLAGRKVRDPGDNRTNVYLLGLAHSAAGKDWPRKVNTRIVHRVGMSGSLGDRFASGEGVQDALYTNPCMLFQTDEIDGMLQSINKAKDARHESIMSTLLTMYSSANSVFPMRRKAGKEAPGSIDQPCLSVFGTAIPNHYYEALSERMLTNGFFARMLILESAKRGSGQEPSILDIPKRVLDTAKWWADFRPGTGNLENWHPVPKIVNHTDEARRILVEARKEAEAEYTKAEDAGDPVGTTVWGRVSEQTRKLALLHAVSANHEHPVIGPDAACWASSFVIHQTKRMLFMAQAHVADSPFHADCLKLMKKLRDAPGMELAHSVLLKRMKIDVRSFAELISTLEQRGDLITEVKNQTGGAGRPTRTYRLIEGGEGNG